MEFPKRIKRTLYVGIGGAGINTLVYLKKQMKTSIGDVPKQIGFLAIDTNTTDLANQSLLAEDEKLCICVREPYERYKAEMRNTTFEYIPEENTSHLLALDRGAGQIRSNGHFAVIESQYLGKFVRVVKEKVDTIRKVQIPEESILHDSKIEVHVVSSLCGGTGSGMLLPVAALLRESIGNCELTGYFYSPEFFELKVEMSAKEVVRQNAYAALAELDYCMHFGKKRHEPITFSFGPNPEQKITFKTRPYNEVLYIGKQTFTRGDGDVEYSYMSDEAVEQLTAQMLMYSATEFLTSHISVLDNVRHKIAEGQFDRGEKVGWAMGFGMASFWFDKEKTIEHSAISLIDKKIQDFLTKNGYDAKGEAYKLLCDLHLNELGNDPKDHDDLINELDRNFGERVGQALETKKNKKYGDNSLVNVKELYSMYVELNNKEERIKNEKENGLFDYINNMLNFRGSYQNRYEFLSQLSTLLDKCQAEMDDEVKAHKDVQDEVEREFKELKDKIKEEDENIGPRPTRGKIKQDVQKNRDRKILGITIGTDIVTVQEEVDEPEDVYNQRIEEWNAKRNRAKNNQGNYTEQQYEDAQKWAILNHEIERKKSAKSIFEGLKAIVDTESRKTKNRINVLESVKGDCAEKKEKLQKEYLDDIAKGSNVDVPNKIRLSASCEGAMFTWDTWLDAIAGSGDDSYMFISLASKVKDAMRSTTASLKDKVKTLHDEWKHEAERENVKGEPKKDRKLTHEMLELYKYSTPLMDVDFHGDKFSLDEFVYVIAKFADNGQKESAPEVGDMIEEMLNSQFSGNTKVQPIRVDDESSVVVLRMVGAVPPYYIRGVADKVGQLSLEHSYENMKNAKVGYTPFSHTVLQQKLENKVSVLKPIRQCDRNLSLDRWINFILLGWIKKSDCDMYFLESQKFGESLNRDLKDTSKIFVLGKGREDARDTFYRFSEELYEEYKSDYDYKLKKNEVVGKDGKTYPIYEMPIDPYLDLFCLEDQNLYDIESAVYGLLAEEKERLLERAKETEKRKANEKCREAIISESKKGDGEEGK